MVFDLYAEALLVNRPGMDSIQAIQDLAPDDLDVTVSDPTPDGTYHVQVPSDIEAVVQISTANPSGAHVDLHTSLPSIEPPTSPRRAITAGEPIRTTFDFFELEDVYTIDLRAGDEIELSATSPQGDMGIAVLGPGQGYPDVARFDDGGGGLYEVDADGKYTATADGTYRIGAFSYDGVVTGYTIAVDPA
jgi:hypothetical protein